MSGIKELAAKHQIIQRWIGSTTFTSRTPDNKLVNISSDHNIIAAVGKVEDPWRGVQGQYQPAESGHIHLRVHGVPREDQDLHLHQGAHYGVRSQVPGLLNLVSEVEY